MVFDVIYEYMIDPLYVQSTGMLQNFFLVKIAEMVVKVSAIFNSLRQSHRRPLFPR